VLAFHVVDEGFEFCEAHLTHTGNFNHDVGQPCRRGDVEGGRVIEVGHGACFPSHLTIMPCGRASRGIRCGTDSVSLPRLCSMVVPIGDGPRAAHSSTFNASGLGVRAQVKPGSEH
jgi:hypothetical protein